MTVRELASSDWPLWKSLRLRALEESPDAFGRTVAEERVRPDAEWRDRLAQTNSSYFVAEVDGSAAAIAGLWIAPDEPEVGNIFSMWVEPSARRRGVGRALLEHAIASAGSRGLASVRLTVTEGNDGAYEMYRRAGFVDTGDREPLREGSALRTLWMAREVQR